MAKKKAKPAINFAKYIVVDRCKDNGDNYDCEIIEHADTEKSANVAAKVRMKDLIGDGYGTSRIVVIYKAVRFSQVSEITTTEVK